ncbi:class I adenylate-forming enzyme family protein [Roseovarius sp. EL26]|uniref:class I adenylate-forming enzyme family protein n=1 Tax=Roseovarius sp. EL26 TaxID=2126672 RepID=UPI000EA164F4|nr:class I adenylate-forming enzyme family protein [Roseovarius sp. EL26]
MTSVLDTRHLQNPCPSSFNLAAHVLGRAEDVPDKVALTILGLTETEQWSYAKLKLAVLGTGTGLLNMGLKPYDRVLIRLGNTVDFPISYLAAIAVGLIPVPTSSQLSEAEVAKILATLQPQAILHADGVALPSTDIPVINTAQLQAMRNLPAADWQMGDPNRPAYIIYTSGTSGKARAVVHAHRAIWARQMMFDGWYGLNTDDRLCHAGAFNWTYTLGTGLMDPWTSGATALIPAAEVQAEALPHLLKQHSATIFAAAPGVYRKLLKSNGLPKLPHLRHGLSAGEKLSDTLRDAWQTATGTEIFEAFGMSECSTFISSSPSHAAKVHTLGKPQPGRCVAIIGPDGPVARNQQGVIAVHRSDPGLMLEYLGAQDETQSRFKDDWFLTGDLGQMDDMGQISYLGRADDMMNAGGFRVSPIEVETVLNAYPGVAQMAVTDIEVKQDARLIMAFYTAPAPLSEDELKQYAAQNLADYKQPRGYFHIDALPSGANGKILRRALRPIYEALNGQA